MRIASKNGGFTMENNRISIDFLCKMKHFAMFFTAILTNFNTTENIFQIPKISKSFYKVKANLLIDVPTPYEVLEWSGKSRNTKTKYHHFCIDLSYFGSSFGESNHIWKARKLSKAIQLVP